MARSKIKQFSDHELVLTRSEVKKLSQLHKTGLNKESWLRRVVNEAKQNRAEAMAFPGARGWRVPSAGRVNAVFPNPEYQGTTVQVCGLYPFVLGSGSPTVGTPLGQHLLNGSTVCADPVSWFLANLVLNPSCFVLGRPGLGKSSLIRRMVTVLQAWGIHPMILGDTKPDYVALIRQLSGQVIEVGRGRNSVNPLDLGPLVHLLEQIPDAGKRRQAVEEMRGRRQTLFIGLLSLVRGAPLQAYEETLLAEALRMLDESLDRPPLVEDVRQLVELRPDRLAAVALDRGDVDHYRKRVEGLLDLLTALGESGPFGDMFSRQTTEHIEIGRPVAFDLSSIGDSDGQLLAAAQSVCWNYGSAVVASVKYLAEAKLMEQQHYFLVMDELWRMLRASDQMVYFLDALTRLNRARGIGQAMITHTMDDLQLASEHLTKIARGFVERAAMVFLGGLSEKEMGNLEEVFGMSGQEKAMITDWSAEGGVNPSTSFASAPPGLGKFLLKIGKKPGTPFRTQLTGIELSVNDTNTAWSELAGRRARVDQEVAA